MVRTLPRWYTKIVTQDVISHHNAAMELKELLLEPYGGNERYVSIAERAFDKMILAIGLYSESEEKLDISKVLLMILFYYFKNFSKAYVWFFNLDTSSREKDNITDIALMDRRKKVFEYYKNLMLECDHVSTKEAMLANKVLRSNYIRCSCNEIESFCCANEKLKVLTRTGWKHWNVAKNRIESDAEHVIGTMILACAMHMAFDYSIDFSKVILMLAIHETEEIGIGDITPFQGISREEKIRRGHIVVNEVLGKLKTGKRFIHLINEFDARRTLEAKFAYQCDKLECDLTAMAYDEVYGPCTFENAEEVMHKNSMLIDIASDGAATMSDFFYLYDRPVFDWNFAKVLDARYSTRI